MLTRTYISKFNTIIKDSTLNTGINPVAELIYGKETTRLLTYFDHTKVKCMVDENIYPDITKLRHYLKITNAGSLDFTQMHCGETSNISDNIKIRATSFDLIFFLIPQEWDNGKGFDYAKSFFNQGYYAKSCQGNDQNTSKLLSEDGSNWYQSRNGYYWDEEGVYSNLTLSKEYDKFSSEEGSKIIFARQHFDIGNENINIDITDIFNKFITGELENYGIGIAYSPMLELKESEVENYIGFLTHKTNTFFEPFIETHYEDYISDDRANFILDKNNKLYLYCNIGDSLEDLDELPTCTVNGKEYDVKQFSKGIYYININLSRNDFKPNTMLFDVWDNIIYQGTKLEAVELDFVVKSNVSYFNIGNSLNESTKVTPKISGINHDEKIYRNNDIRKINVINRIQYDRYKTTLLDSLYYRLYILDGTREVTVIPYTNINKTFLENYFLIDCEMLIPQEYHIDIKVKYNQEYVTYKDVLKFKIIDNLNNKYN